jgi:hypothetical protein
MMTGWRLAYWTLLASFVLSAALNLLHVRAGFLTSYLADATVPALFYVMARELAPGKALRPRRVARALGRTPERAALLLVLASGATELSQVWWPRGCFAGRFDPLDIPAYGTGLAECWGIERIQYGQREAANGHEAVQQPHPAAGASRRG